LQATQPSFRRFCNRPDVIAFAREATSIDPREDEVQRPIFEANARDRDARWRAILSVILWRGLESIHFQKRGRDPHADER
jgi:hypothetical protein